MNNLPQKYNFISYVKKFFYNLFNKKNKKIKHDIRNEIPVEENSIFMDKLKEYSKKTELKKYIMERLEKNPSILESLPIWRLEQIENMYDEVIQENNIKIKELDFKINAYKNV